jgi:hypothetical protein
MKFKKYTLGSIVLIAIIGVFAYITFPKPVLVDLYFIELDMPMAVWIVAPVVLMFIVSLFHMFIYSIKFILNEKNLKKDETKLVELIKHCILNEPSNDKFKNKTFANIAKLLNSSSIEIDKNFVSEFEPIQEAISKVTKIQNGEYINLRAYKLNEQNSYRQQNMRNKAILDSKYALKVVKNIKKYSEETRSVAMKAITKAELLRDAKHNIKSVNKDTEVAHQFFTAVSKHIEIELSKQEIMDICKHYKFTENDYIKLAKEFKTNYENIGEYLQFFEDLASDIGEAFAGYVYALIDLEMIDKALDVLSSVSYDRYKELNIYLQMKKANIKYPIEQFLAKRIGNEA